MPVPDFESYKVAGGEVSSATKFNNFVQATEDEFADIDQDQITGLAWATYVPTVTGSGSNPTIGSGGFQEGRYMQFGKLVVGWVRLTMGSAGFVNGSGAITVSLPVSAAVPTPPNPTFGVAEIIDISPAGSYTTTLLYQSPTTIGLRAPGASNSFATWNGAPITIAATDQINFQFMYEGA